MSEKYATIKDIAKMANVSTATVSHVLNNTRYVRPEVRKRVEEALRIKNYVHNNAARALRSNKTNTIGVIIPDVTNLFFAKIVKSLENILNQNGYQLLLCHSGDDYEKELEHIKTLSSARVDGIVMAPASATYDYSALPISKNFPLIFIDRCPNMERYSGVFVNSHDIIQYAVEQLILAGHKNIGCMIGEIKFITTYNRKKGYIDALEKHGIPVRNDLILSGVTKVEAGYEMMSYLLRATDATAVFIANNKLSLGAMQYLSEMNIDVPGRMAIIGFAAQEWASVTKPKLTTVYEPLSDIGVAAARMILKMVENPDMPEERITIDACITERSSY